MRTEAAIALRDRGQHGEAQALFSQNVQEIEAQAAHAPPSEHLLYLKHQYRGIAAAPRAFRAARFRTSASSCGGSIRTPVRRAPATDAPPYTIGECPPSTLMALPVM